jgi:hypothetical protein
MVNERLLKWIYNEYEQYMNNELSLHSNNTAFKKLTLGLFYIFGKSF